MIKYLGKNKKLIGEGVCFSSEFQAHHCGEVMRQELEAAGPITSIIRSREDERMLNTWLVSPTLINPGAQNQGMAALTSRLDPPGPWEQLRQSSTDMLIDHPDLNNPTSSLFPDDSRLCQVDNENQPSRE